MNEKGRAGLRLAASVALAIGLIGLGLLSLVYRDFTLQWEPVPARWPDRGLLAVASGLILLGAGLAILVRRTRPWGAIVAAAFIGLWAIALQSPKALAHPTDISVWLAVAECTAMALGAFVLFRDPKPGVGTATRLFGLCCLVFGASHFVYAKFTAAMVPRFLPMPLVLAYATGAVHALTGLALVLRRWVRPAAAIEAAMMTSFVLLVHAPRVAAAPTSRTEITLLLVALTLTASAWIIATARKAA
jgi:uncharacterized membrane protein